MTSRRNFVSGLAGFGAAAVFRPNAIASMFKANIIAGDRTPEEVAEDESYWTEIQRAFDTDRTLRLMFSRR